MAITPSVHSILFIVSFKSVIKGSILTNINPKFTSKARKKNWSVGALKAYKLLLRAVLKKNFT